jgi:hypothetical protein
VTVAGTYLDPVRTKVEATEAVEAFAEACADLWGDAKAETVATLTAQSALESGRWRSMWNFNPSNVKHGRTRQGFYTCIKLNEVLMRHGRRVVVWFDPVLGELVSKNGGARYPERVCELPPGHYQTRMRAFESFTDGVRDKLQFLNRRRYQKAKAAALGGDPGAYVERCHAAGYFTASLTPYRRATVSLFKTYLPIAQGLAEAPAELPEPEEHRVCLDMAECMRVPISAELRATVERLIARSMVVDHEELRDARNELIAEDDRWE